MSQQMSSKHVFSPTKHLRIAKCSNEPELGPSALFLLRKQFGDPNVLHLRRKVDLQRTYVCG